MDLTVFILAAAEHAAEEHHKSELPFFIAGGILVVFSVAISVFGFKRPDFPANASATRGIMTLSTVLMLAAVSSAIYVAI